MKRFFIICILVTISASQIFAQSPRRSSRSLTSGNRHLFPVRKKPNSRQKKNLQPKSADLAKFANFLSQPKTGIFRLFPDLGCEENPNIVKADKKCLEAIPESSFYSFREKEHTAVYLSDIRLKNDHFITDGILTNGFLVRLGDVELDKISPSTEALNFMQNYSVQADGAEAQKQFIQMSRGIKSGKFLYRKTFPVAENTAYALRVIAFRGSVYRTFHGFRYNLLQGDKRIDMTVALRVVGKNEDGSITILWKELDRRDAPKFQFPKRKSVKK
ncbi:hypothetical protein BH20ACI4_BH20ACI4_22430 [soil metagenome]